MIYRPVLGLIDRQKSQAVKQGNYWHDLIVSASEKPKAKGFGSIVDNKPALYLFDVDAIKDFSQKLDCYQKSRTFFGLIKELLGNSVLLSEGAEWKRHRKYVTMAFNFDYLRLMVPEVAKIADELLEKLKNKDLENIDLMSEIQAITAEIIGRLFFGQCFYDMTIDGKTVTGVLSEIINEMGMMAKTTTYLLFGIRFVKLGLFKEHRDLLRKMRRFHEFSIEIIKARLNAMKCYNFQHSSSRKSMLELFLEQRMQNQKDAFTDQEIIDEFSTFLLAGMDTTAHLITMAMYYIMTNPGYKKELMEEIKEALSDPTNITYEKINSMNFMTIFMKETLRINTPIPQIMFREAIVDHKLGDISIKKGTIVNVSFFANNYDPRFHEDPHLFKPHRML